MKKINNSNAQKKEFLFEKVGALVEAIKSRGYTPGTPELHMKGLSKLKLTGETVGITFTSSYPAVVKTVVEEVQSAMYSLEEIDGGVIVHIPLSENAGERDDKRSKSGKKIQEYSRWKMFFTRALMTHCGLAEGENYKIDTVTPRMLEANPLVVQISTFQFEISEKLETFLAFNSTPHVKTGLFFELQLTSEHIAKTTWIRKLEKSIIVGSGNGNGNDSSSILTIPVIEGSQNRLGTYLYQSHDYTKFETLEFNRGIQQGHVSRLMLSMKRFGLLTFPIMTETDCVDGTKRIYIVDGQHRFRAMKLLGLPIWYTMVTISNLEELVKLIADLNNTSRTWSNQDFLKAWCSLKIADYLLVQKEYARTKIALFILLQAYSGFNKNDVMQRFKAGDFKAYEKKKGATYIEFIHELKTMKKIPKSTSVQSTFLEFFKMTPKYDHVRMKENLSRVPGIALLSEEKGEILGEIQRIYAS